MKVLSAKLLLFGIIYMVMGCAHMTQEKIKFFTFRLKPGQELKTELGHFAKENHLKAASIISAVGSLTKYSLRFANQDKISSEKGHFEITSLSGTLSEDSMHVHMAVSDSKGRIIGGHLSDGNTVYTTCEIIIVEQVDKVFLREQDAQSGYNELVIKNR